VDAKQNLVVLQLGQWNLVQREDIRAAETVDTHDVQGTLGHEDQLLIEQNPAVFRQVCRR
jgi:hypothetical protein